jgi:hypothetical protein
MSKEPVAIVRKGEVSAYDPASPTSLWYKCDLPDGPLYSAPPDAIPRQEHEAMCRERDLLHDKLKQFEAYGFDNVASVLFARAALREEHEAAVAVLKEENESLRGGLCPECTTSMRERGCGGDYHAILAD